jgi:hypothetical protein
MTSYTPSSTPDATVVNLEQKLIAEINSLNRCLNGENCNISSNADINSISLMTNTAYTENHQYILNLWNTIRRLRNELDVKLQRVNLINNSEAKEQEMKLNNTIYINVLLAVLSTSILFFLFSRKK